ncbi:MAG: ATP-binding protein [Bacteroidales bacterium]|nr:ATP-binding protein [Bacteroidales bacterium]
MLKVLKHGLLVVSYLFQFYIDSSAQVRFRKFSVEDGLSNNFVRCIFQDSIGFIWVGTKDGLNRFDGSDFVKYFHSENSPNSISNNTINVIQQFDSRKLIICTSGGIDFYDFYTDSFTHSSYFKDRIVLTLLRDTGGWYWVGTFDGLYYANFTKNSYIDFSQKPYDLIGLKGRIFMCFYKDTRGRLWAGTDSGLNIFDLSRMHNTVVLASSRGGLSSNYVQDIEVDPIGNVWIGTGQGGLDYCLAHEVIKENPYIKNYLPGSVMDILCLSENQIWFGNGSGKGLFRIRNPFNSPTIDKYLSDPFDLYSISDNSIECVYRDKDGGLWIGTYAGGLNFYSHRFKKFYSSVYPALSGKLSSNSVNAFVEDNQFLWIGTENGLNRIDKKTGKLKVFYANGKGKIGSNAVYALFIDSKRRLWVGTWAGGLNLYNYKTETFSTFTHDPSNPYSLPSNNVFTINEDSNHQLWIGTIRGGLSRFDEKNNRFINFTYNPTKKEGIFSNSVCHIAPTSDGKLWISTYFSADLFDPETETFTHYTNIKKTGSDLNYIFIDSKGNTWFGSESGLTVMPYTKQNVKHYSYKDVLKNIKAIIEDSKGNLWISTNRGLVRFDNGVNIPENPFFTSYHIHDGLQGNDFNRRAVYKNSDGMLYFGGVNGYTWFYPDSIEQNPILPKVYIAKILNYNNLQPILKATCCNDTIVLKYDQNNLIIEFSSISYIVPEHNHYRYRLTGFEKAWHTVTNRQPAIYTNLQPGRYTFEIYACNNDDVWGEIPTRITIIINPPWWKTIYFYIGLITCSILTVIGIFRLRLQNLRKIKKELEEIVMRRTEELLLANKQLEESQEEIVAQNNELEMHRYHLEQLVESRTKELQQALKRAEESDKLKSAFLANMSHEIRTPMNAILGFSTLIAEEMIPPDKRNEYLNIIQKNCDTLNVLINDILDLSMIESDQIKFIYAEVNVTQLMLELERQYQIAKPEKIEVAFVTKTTNEIYTRTDYVRLKQILSNLLGNAIKFTDEGYVHFGYQVKGNVIEFFVKDTGIGIDPTQKELVFRPFGKINPSHATVLYRGTGLGLSISKKLIELMGGSIWFETEVGKGTVFYFTIPYTAQTNTKEVIPQQLTTQIKLDLHNKVLIVAEDETDNFYFINEVLQQSGAKVLWAKDGEELISLLDSVKKPDLILMDIKMPKIDGIEAISLIRERGYFTPVIAITAHAYRNEQIEIMRHSFDGYIAKPIKKTELMRTIAKFIVR